jgi:hypothetical protein
MRTRKIRKHFIVSVEMPDGVSTREMQDYIRDSVRSYAGGLRTQDPLSRLNRKLVTCMSLKELGKITVDGHVRD